MDKIERQADKEWLSKIQEAYQKEGQEAEHLKRSGQKNLRDTYAMQVFHKADIGKMVFKP